MDTNSSIFIRKSSDSNSNDVEINSNNENTKDFKEAILKSIPINATQTQNKDLQNTKTEWRWRIFKFPAEENKTKTVIEISYINPNSKRIFINREGKWVQRDVDVRFDAFISQIFYHYVDFKK